MIPKITIITPSFNQGQFLEQTIQSVITQNYPNLEYFVIDGGSTDNSVEIIKKYEANITYWESEKDKGQAHAINKGLAKATGEIITWINSDDLLEPNALKEISELFSELPNSVGVVHGASILFNATGDIETDTGYPNASVERYLSGMAFPQPSSFFKKEYLNQIGERLDESLHYGMDYDLFSKLALICDFHQTSGIFSKYRLHQESKTMSATQFFLKEWKEIFLQRIHQLDLKYSIDFLLTHFNDQLNQQPPLLAIKSKPIIDERKMLFYHLSYQLKYNYWIGNLNEARKLKKVIIQEFSKELIQKEKNLAQIFGRLKKYPNLVIKQARIIKSLFSVR